MNDGQTSSSLAQLQALLAGQLDLARRGEHERVAAVAAEASRLLSRLAAEGLGEQDRAALKRAGELYRQVCLALAAERSELGQRLEKMRRGRTSLRAYSQANDL